MIEPTDESPSAATQSEAGRSFADIAAEVTAEAHRRRTSGEYPADVLERLDADFDRFAPLTYRRTGIDGAIRAVESAAFVNVDVPTAASRRPFELVKTAVKRSTAWYHLHVARQVTTLGIQVTRPLRMLADDASALRARVDGMEQRLGPVAAIRTAAAMRSLPLAQVSADEMVAWLDGHAGQVIVHGADLAQVAQLLDHGVDVSAVARLNRAEVDAPELLDVRLADVGDHLATIDDGVLGAVVLAGPSIDVRSTDDRIGLVMNALRTLRPGGRLVIVGTAPATWDSTVGVETHDLAPGRPLAAASWVAVLDALDARAVRVVDDSSGRVVVMASSS